MEKYLKGVNGELSYEELNSICQTDVPKGDYYDYEKIRAVLLRKLNGEIDDKYFRTWLIVVCWALSQKKYRYISWAFDGFSFEDTFDKKKVLEIMANLKDYDYKMRHKSFLKQHKAEKLQVIYLRVEYCNWAEDSVVYKAYFVDYKNKRFDLRFIDDAFFEFNQNLVYCFINEKDPWDDSDDDGERYECESWEEVELMNCFFDETEHWVCDHTLQF
jgi:hypothetical protein